MITENPDTEKIAIAIAEEYAHLRNEAMQIAIALQAAIEAEGIPVIELTAWIRDRPRHNLSIFELRNWRKKRRLALEQ